MGTRIHGHAGTKDGKQTRSPTFNSWRCAIDRCTRDQHPFYHRYGERGITVCARWLHGEDGKSGFECFLADMGERPDKYHTLERIDKNGNYEKVGPDGKPQCKWASVADQANNREGNHTVSLHGETLTISQAVDKLGIRSHYGAVVWRLGHGWDPFAALTTPFMTHRKGKRKNAEQSSRRTHTDREHQDRATG